MLALAAARHLDSLTASVTLDETGATGNVFVYHMPSTPDLAVMVTTGARPQLTKAAADLPTMQLIVRGTEHNPTDGLELALELYGLLTCSDLTTWDEGGADEVYVITCTASQSGPTPMGRDVNDRYEWSLNFQLRTVAPTAHRPQYV